MNDKERDSNLGLGSGGLNKMLLYMRVSKSQPLQEEGPYYLPTVPPQPLTKDPFHWNISSSVSPTDI